ncbi:hypothetical protein COO60DRAFT_1520094 [Scenedesmus sp. NREL 46B-D3]|nr:hypothetical protein COO60DRAFT_1520094 [Scenedesmus sp. NREL 46B-D3]
MSATLSKSCKSQQQQQLGRCKQAAAVPRVAVRNSKRQQPVIKAVLTTIPRVAERSSGSNDSDSMGSLRVMSLISSLVDIEAQVQQFETVAGRSAMIGFFVALGAELATEQSIFRSVSASEAVSASAVLLGAILLAAAAAAANKRQNLGVDIKEAVITSMTAVRRSAASVTGKQVDFAVDNVLSKVFDMGVIYSLLADDDIM